MSRFPGFGRGAAVLTAAAVVSLLASVACSGGDSGDSPADTAVGGGTAAATATSSPLPADSPTSTPTPAPPDAPGLSLPPGAYAGPTSVELLAEPGTEIWYTLDGDAPRPGSSNRYEGPLDLHGDVTLRAVAAVPAGTPSEEATARYRVFSERLELDEPIMLSGDDVLEFTDAYVVHRGPIELRDDARLVIRDSIFIHDKDFAFEHELTAWDRSAVVVERSGIGTTCTGSFNWAFFNESRLDATDVDPTYAGCNTWNFMSGTSQIEVARWDTFSGTVCDGSSVDVRESETLELELCFSQGSAIDTTLPAVIDEFTFDREDDPGAAYSLHVTDSVIEGWGVNVLPGMDVTIRDAEAITIGVIVGLPWDSLTVELSGLQRGRYEDQTWEIGDSRLHLVNTNVYGWEPNVFHNNTLVIRDSDYSGSAINSGTAHYEIVNSRAGQLVAGERVTMTVRDSTITGDVVANEDATIVLIDSVVEGVLDGDGRRVMGNVIARDNGRVILRGTEVLGETRTEANGQVIVE